MSDIDAPNTRVFSANAAQTLNGAKKSDKAAQEGAKGINFSEIIRNNGQRVSNGLNDISDRAGITAVGERPDNAPDMDDAPRDYNDNAGNAPDPYDDSNSRADQGSQPPAQAAAEDDYGRQQADARPTEAKAEAGDNSQNADSDNRGETAPDRDNQNADSGQGNEDAHASESKLAAASEGENSGNDKAAGDGGDAAQASGADGKTVKTTVTSNAEQILSTLLASAQNSGLPGQTAEKAGEQTEAAGGARNAEVGLTKARSAVANKANAGNAGSGQAKTGDQSGQARATATAQANANAQLQERADVRTNNATVVQQAAQLSKAIGDGNKVEVSVTVADEAKTMISRPTTTLASGAAIASETGKSSLRSQQAQAGPNATAGQAQLAAQASAAQTQQAPQPVAGTQAQIINAASTDAKGAVQAGGLQNAASGGGDGPGTAATNTTQTTQQAPQSASAKAAAAPRFSLPGQTVTNQVSVQITKAVNAGADKIRIQLRPADLGRVEVKMEIAADGRVQAAVTVDNKNTLDLLRQDSKGLEQALQDAGLETDSDSLSFNLREQQGEGEEAEYAGPSGPGMDADDGEDASDGVIAAGDRDIITDSRIDVRA